MTSDELITQVRNLAQVPDNDEDITDEFILTQAYLGLLERFTHPIVLLRNGTWLHSYTFETTAGVSRYRLPHRSIVQGLEKIECATAQGSSNSDSSGWYLLNVQTNIQATDYEGLSYRGRPAAFTYVGDTVDIYPTPTSNWTLRVWYYLRPSRLCLVDDDATAVTFHPYPQGNGTYIIDLDTVDWYLYDGPVDFQFVAGNCETVLVDIPIASPVNGSNECTVTLTDTEASLLQMQAGTLNTTAIVVKSGEATPYIPLPQELCNALVSYVGAVVLAEKGDSEKAQVFSQKAEVAIKNIVDLAIPRSKGQPSVYKTRNTYLRRRIGRFGFGGGYGY